MASAVAARSVLFLDEGVKSGVITRPVTVEFIDD